MYHLYTYLTFILSMKLKLKLR